MTQRTHAVAKTRAHQVRWSSRCRSRARGSGRDASGAATATAPSSAPGAPAAVARGRGNEAKLLLPSSSSAPVVGALRTRHRGSHALLRPQKSKLDTTPTFKRVSSSKPPAFLNPAALSACGLPSLAAPFLPRSIPVPSPFLRRSFTVPSPFLHRSFTVPSPFPHHQGRATPYNAITMAALSLSFPFCLFSLNWGGLGEP
jgi:hypothetical protein